MNYHLIRSLIGRNRINLQAEMFVFVYGTLKTDEPNHHWLTDTGNGSATFVGTGVMQNKYPLIIASRYNIPFLLDQLGTGKVQLTNLIFFRLFIL